MCPFCRTPLQKGAIVCPGCQAELKFRKPPLLRYLIGYAVGALILFGGCASFFDGSNPEVTDIAAILGGIMLISLGVVLQRRARRKAALGSGTWVRTPRESGES